MHRDEVGWAISIVEEIMFLGFVTAILYVWKGDLSFKQIWNGGGYLSFMKCSIIGYPVLIVISIICEKSGILYEDEYSDMPIIGLLFFNIWNDIIFPVYALINIAHAPAAALIAVGSWIAYALFLYFSLR